MRSETPVLPKGWKRYADGSCHHEDCAKVSISRKFIFPDTACTCGGQPTKAETNG